MGLTMAQLDALAEKHLALPQPPEPRQQTAPRDARHQVLGAMKLIARMSGKSMVTEVAATELFVERVNELEAQAAAKDAHIARLEKALDNIYAVLEIHADNPFDLKPVSKWNKGQLAQRILRMVEDIRWSTTRVENELRPECAVPLIAGPKD